MGVLAGAHGSDAVTERIRERLQERPWHVEGYEGRQWVLLDYVDLVVHIFSTDKRQFYDLERLWGDAPRELIDRSEEHTSELQSRGHLVCRLLLEKKKEHSIQQ